jgi:hypothetical protein
MLDYWNMIKLRPKYVPWKNYEINLMLWWMELESSLFLCPFACDYLIIAKFYNEDP